MSASEDLPVEFDVLLVEDDPDDALLVREDLSDASTDYRLTHVSTWADARAQMHKQEFSAVLLDLSLPDASGIELIGYVKKDAPNTPIVVMTGLDDDVAELRALHEGAQDYLVKGQANVLDRTLRHAIERARILCELDEARRAQLETKDQFLSHVSHELRTPLAAIHQFVTILLDSIPGELNSDQRDYLEIVLRNVMQLRDMISDLMDATRAETGKLSIEPVPLDLGRLILEATDDLQGLAEHQRISLSAEFPSDLPWVLADASRVTQILANLVSNAVKFTSEGGRIVMRAGVCEDDPTFLQVSVQDTGCGISPEGVIRIFDRLYQEAIHDGQSRQGLGLGLYICKELAARQGGRIWVESELNEGSTFHFTLPIYSVAELLRPVLEEDGEIRSEVLFIDVAVSPGDARASLRVNEATFKEIQDLLRSTVTPCRDLVLPRTPSDQNDARFFVVAGTDASGVEPVLARIQKQLERCAEVSEGLARVDTLHQVIEVPSEEPGAVEMVGLKIEALTRGARAQEEG